MPDGEFHKNTNETWPVRLATEGDESRLYETLLALNEDNSFGVSLDRDKILAQLRKGTRRDGGIVGVIDGENGEIAATIGLYLNQWWYSSEWYLGELWLFVRPDYRNLQYDRGLFKFAEWCRQQMKQSGGQDWVVVTSVSSPKRLAAKSRLWSRHADQIGAIFVMRD